MSIQELNEKEERLRFLLSKIEAELAKFKDIKENLLEKKQKIMEEVSKIGIENISLTFTAEDQENVLEIINSHILELENLKSYIASELNKVLKQKELEKQLKEKYQDKVNIELNQFGGFKIKYKDEDVINAINAANVSKKLIENLKQTILKK